MSKTRNPKPKRLAQSPTLLLAVKNAIHAEYRLIGCEGWTAAEFRDILDRAVHLAKDAPGCWAGPSGYVEVYCEYGLGDLNSAHALDLWFRIGERLQAEGWPMYAEFANSCVVCFYPC